MTLDSVLAKGRRAAEARMTSRCVVRRPLAWLPIDPGTGARVRPWEIVHADWPIEIMGSQAGAGQVRTLDQGAGVEVTVSLRQGRLPVASGVRDDDHIDVTLGECTGMVFKVIEGDTADHKTALRVPMVAVQRPGEWATP